MRRVVADASPLILLSRIGQLHLLPGLCSEVIVPRAVYDEVVQAGAGLPGSADLAAATWPRILEHDPDHVLFRNLRGDLGLGESAGIVLALAEGADLVVIDERKGRLAAQRLGLKVKGTVGVLVAAYRSGDLEELAPALDALVEQGGWVSAALRRAALSAVDEGRPG